MFQADTKKMMITTAGLLGFRINQNQRKAEIEKKMALAILAYPLQVGKAPPSTEYGTQCPEGRDNHIAGRIKQNPGR